MKVVLLGLPGAGKGTQAKKLSAYFEIPHISAGDLLRAEVRSGSKVGDEIQRLISAGDFVADETTVALLDTRTTQSDCGGGYILDGFPRTVNQAKDFDRILAQRFQKIDCVIEVEVQDSVILDRITGRMSCSKDGSAYHLISAPPKKSNHCDLCGAILVQREDDTEAVVKKRIQKYHDEIAAIKALYDPLGIVKIVEGAQSVEKVFADMVVAVSGAK